MKTTFFSQATWMMAALICLSLFSCQSGKSPSADVNIDSLVDAKVAQKLQERDAAQIDEDEEVEEIDPILAHEAERAQGNPCSGDFYYGTIGGDNHCQVNMPSNYSIGYYTFTNYTRDLAFESYDPSTRTLILTAYEQGTGKYVGKFVGKYGRDGNYKGVFTNYKGGKVNFDLDIAGD